MGIRLYPNTDNVAILEKLAGVKPGTAARLAEIETRHAAEIETAAHEERYDLGYKHWQEIDADEDLGSYSHFMLYGWGKFDGAGIAIGECGSLNDLSEVATLFQRMGINADPAECQGVHWC